MKKVIITRFYQENNLTIGRLLVIEGFSILFECYTLERGWKNNSKNISRIPASNYKCVYEYSNKFNTKLYEIKGVKNRSECKFHGANYWHQLSGCIALGEKTKHIDKDGYIDVTNSVKSLDRFEDILNGMIEFDLLIIDSFVDY